MLAFVAPVAGAAERIVKVLPLLLDRDGMHARTPSLYERDAYQAHLQRNPKLQSGMMYAVQLNAKSRPNRQLRLRLELRGIASGNLPRQVAVDCFVPVKSGRWVYLTLREAERDFLGEVTAWRASLWEENGSNFDEGGAQLLAEQKSFLW